MPLTFGQLLRETRTLARAVRNGTETHRKLATTMDEQARDTGRIAEQIAALKVDTETVAETREVARIMLGLSTSAIAYATAADDASRAASAAEQRTITDHGGIKEAADRSPAPMADRGWYRQE